MLLREVTEGIRMGSRELSATPKKDYTIGFEFEVAVSDNYRDDNDPDSSNYDLDELWDRFANDWYSGGSTFDFEDWFKDYIRYNGGLITIRDNFEPRYGNIESAKELLKFKQREEERRAQHNIKRLGEKKVEKIIEYMKKFPEESSLESAETDEIEKLVRFVYNDVKNLSTYQTDDEWQQVFQRISKEKLMKNALAAWNSIKFIYDFEINHQTITIDDIDGSFNEGDYIYGNEEKTEIIEVANDINDLEDVTRYYEVDEDELRDITQDAWVNDESELMSQEFNDWAARRMYSKTGGKLQYVRNLVDQLPNALSWRVEEEATSGVDAEIITNVMKIPEGIKSLKRMFELIEQNENLSTNTATGLHVNIGSWNRTDWNQVDWLKFLIVYRADRALQAFGREINRYAVDKLDTIISDLENKSLDQFYENISMINQIVIRLSPKMSAVNLSKLSTRGHIEIRAPGGKNYHLKTNEMVNQIQRAVRALEIASDPDAYKNEYIKKLYKILGAKKQQQAGGNEVERLFGKFGIKYNKNRPLIAISALMTQPNFSEVDGIYNISTHRQLVDDLRKEDPQYVAEELRYYLKFYGHSNSKFLRLLINQFPLRTTTVNQ